MILEYIRLILLMKDLIKKISKAYLEGRYGAIPQFKSLHINELE